MATSPASHRVTRPAPASATSRQMLTRSEIHGPAARHRLDDRHAEVLGVRRQHEDVGVTESRQLVPAEQHPGERHSPEHALGVELPRTVAPYPSSGPARTRCASGRCRENTRAEGAREQVEALLEVGRPRNRITRRPRVSGQAARNAPSRLGSRYRSESTPGGTTTPGLRRPSGRPAPARRGREVESRRPVEVPPLEQALVHPLPDSMTAEEIGVERAVRPDQVGHAEPPAVVGGHRRGEEVQRVHVDQVVLRHRMAQRRASVRETTQARGVSTGKYRISTPSRRTGASSGTSMTPRPSTLVV